jgi:hypothetical protein
MEDILERVDKSGGSDKLERFLGRKFPHVLRTPPPSKPVDLDRYFQTGLLTYPRRRVFRGAPGELRATLDKFVRDKIKYDHLLVDGAAYVEYLEKSDAPLVNKIPAKNWILRRHKESLNDDSSHAQKAP